jgi:hypothetical protein
MASDLNDAEIYLTRSFPRNFNSFARKNSSLHRFESKTSSKKTRPRIHRTASNAAHEHGFSAKGSIRILQLDLVAIPPYKGHPYFFLIIHYLFTSSVHLTLTYLPTLTLIVVGFLPSTPATNTTDGEHCQISFFIIARMARISWMP